MLLPRAMRPGVHLAVFLFVLRGVVELAPPGFVTHRLALLALATGGLAFCTWSLRALRTDRGLLSAPWHRSALLASRAAFVLFGPGAVADVLGGVAAATLLVTGTAHTFIAAILLALTAVILRSMVRIALLTDTARRLGITPVHSDRVRATAFRTINALATITWSAATLRGFSLLDPLLAGLRRAFDWTFSIGEFTVDPGNILIFGVVIWLSFKLATLVEFLLTVQLVPRVGVPRGVPEAVSRLTRYVVIALGAVVASAAAGFDVSNVTIIVGALAVGVGFGLQNIVNNFVSGLILLFERPIRVGDTLELGGTGGRVEKIGMRASIVRTRDGAEIIVPNARLISEDVTNWTLTHDRRRIVIPVGIAYGTEPERAAGLIVGVARASEDVDERPEPTCLFAGFGESSLDFRLYAWIAASMFLEVSSALRVAIAHALEEAGIEIPFPQRDLHLRSADPQAVPWTGLPREPEDPRGS